MQPIYPEEAEARGLIKDAEEWIRKNVRNVEKEGETGKLVGEEGIRDVTDCQKFVMTAPGPGSEGNRNLQREYPFSVLTFNPLRFLHSTLFGSFVHPQFLGGHDEQVHY